MYGWFQFLETAASLLQTPQILISGHFDDQNVGSTRTLLLAKPDWARSNKTDEGVATRARPCRGAAQWPR